MFRLKVRCALDTNQLHTSRIYPAKAVCHPDPLIHPIPHNVAHRVRRDVGHAPRHGYCLFLLSLFLLCIGLGQSFTGASTVHAIERTAVERAGRFAPSTDRVQQTVPPVDPPPDGTADVPAGQDVTEACINSFPTPAFETFLPLLLRDDGTAQSSTPHTPPEKLTGRLVPLGDQLDDVGQYYSQVAPGLRSSLTLTNPSDIRQTFALTLYTETGGMALATHGCRIDPQSAITAQMKDGKLLFTSETDTGNLIHTPDSLCTIVEAQTPLTDTQAIGFEPNGLPPLHGIYHARVASSAPSVRAPQIRTTPADSALAASPAGTYPAIGAARTSATLHLPALLATRTPQNWWDSEIAIQNVSDGPVRVQFRLCDQSGACFDNNSAVLAAQERRNFLATHLLYSDEDGFLRERTGWFAATITATSLDASMAAPRIVALTSFFKQAVRPGAAVPRAEEGSLCLQQAVAPTPQRSHEIPLDHADARGTVTPPEPAPESHVVVHSEHGATFDTLFLRLYNHDGATTTVTVHLLDAGRNPLATRKLQLGPRTASNWTMERLFAGFDATQGAAAATLRITADRAIAIFAWDDGRILSTQPFAQGEQTWYAPIVAAPIVPFRWDGSDQAMAARADTPGAQFGLADSKGVDHALRPEWARRLNWYMWGVSGASCNQTVSEQAAYSTYIPMWRGLTKGGCGGGRGDRSCVNSPERLQAVRNDLPSNCVGRPLFLANEPDHPDQSFMTYHELGRLIYVMRSWPGELYSPVFASHIYDAPRYIPEHNAWCQQAQAANLCPGPEECHLCNQDGVVDGAWDPHDISFAGLEAYFNASDRWAVGQSWRFEDVVEGMLLHFYPEAGRLQSDLYPNYLQRYRDRAAEVGWPIIVNEYGLWPQIDQCTIAHKLDDVRRMLQHNLGDNQARYNHNPFKLFWFSTDFKQRSSDPVERLFGVLDLFDGPTTLTVPVGRCWHADAVELSAGDTECTQMCWNGYLPLVSHPQ